MSGNKQDQEAIAIQAVLDFFASLDHLEQDARGQVVRYAQERLNVYSPPHPDGENRTSTIRPSIKIRQLVAPIGAITVCIIFLAVMMLLVLGGPEPMALAKLLGGPERVLPYPVNNYADLYRMLFAVVFTITLQITQRRGAFYFYRRRDVVNPILSVVLFCIFPIFLFLVTLPVVRTFLEDLRLSRLLLTAYWIVPIFGIQQAWLLLARPLGWSQTEEVEKGRKWVWWLAFFGGVIGPICMLFAWRALSMPR